MFTFDETTDVGRDTGSAVTSDYVAGNGNTFTGGINWVRVEVGDDDHTEPHHKIQEALLRQ